MHILAESQARKINYTNLKYSNAYKYNEADFFMVVLMNKSGILNWMNELIEANKDINPPQIAEGFLKHIDASYDIAAEITENALNQYPAIPLNVAEVALAGGLHDIGRLLRKKQDLHELRGARLIEQEGLAKEVADNERDVVRIAQMMRSHGLYFDKWNYPEYIDEKKEFEPIDIALLVPRTWQEAIVTTSDLRNVNGQRVDPRGRFEELLVRYSTNPKYQSETEVKAISAAKDRMLLIADRVELLEHGKIPESELFRYGFI